MAHADRTPFFFKYKIHSMPYVLISTNGDQLLVLMPSTTQIFQPVSLVTMSIVVTRMHRSLVDFVTGSTHMCDALPFVFPPPLKWVMSV
jgi:hypothetical protein